MERYECESFYAKCLVITLQDGDRQYGLMISSFGIVSVVESKKSESKSNLFKQSKMEREMTNDTIKDIGCCCSKCLEVKFKSLSFMVVCQKCGNKRCPHASDHDNECTNSNEPGQKGSAYQ